MNRHCGRGGWMRRGLATGLATGVLWLAGCAQMGVIMFSPDPSAKAKFKLTKAPLLVLVDETAGAAEPLVRYQAARELTTQLRENKVNTQIVPDRTVQRIQRAEPASAEWTAAELGNRLGVEQVLHVELDPYVPSHHAMDPTARSRLSASVRVIDVKDDVQLWPLERAGYQVVFEMPVRDIHTLEPAPELKESLATGLADSIAKLFYKHRISEREAFRRGADEGRLP